MIEKSSVRQSFSKGAKEYDKYAFIQKKMALMLGEKLKNSELQKTILEIGCGTGILSEILIKKYKNSNFTFIDISEEMIKKCKDKIGENICWNYKCCDGEKFSNGNFDLICSNAVFQWFTNLKESINSYLSMLNSGGVLAFTTFGPENFFEFSEAAKNAGIDGYSLDYFSYKKIISYIPKGYKVDFNEIKIEEEYDSFIEFLRYIKKIGAVIRTTENKNKMSLKKFKAMEEYFKKKDGNFKITNHIYFFIIKKENIK